VIQLRSGDLLVFGGPSRLILHGSRAPVDCHVPPELTTYLKPGRLNLTFRQTHWRDRHLETDQNSGKSTLILNKNTREQVKFQQLNSEVVAEALPVQTAPRETREL